MSSRERAPAVQAGMKSSIRPVLMGVLAGVLVCILCLLVFSVILSAQNIPQAAIEPMAIFSVCMGGLFAGFVCTKITRSNGLVYGLICGGVMAMVMLLASFGFSDSGLGVPALFKIVFILLSSMIGGILGVNTKTRRKSRK